MAMAFQLKKMIVLKVIFVVQIFNVLEVSESSPVIKQPAKCSRPHSKFVREYFARSLLPIYQSYGVPVPEKCPFSPLYDIYHYHENNKTKSDTHKWKCEICGKYFTSEPFLDNHFDRRHKDSLQLNENSVCLGSYCRIFRCDFLMAMESRRKPPDTKCYESIMQTLNKKCKSHLDLCIPRGIPFNIQNKLTVELRENLCSYLTCSRINELPSYMSNGPNFFIVFVVVIFLGLCIIAYGVINHTDLIFDENEEVEPINFEANIEIPKVQTKKAKKQQQQPIIDTNNYTSQTARIEKLNDLSSKYKYIDRLSSELRRRNNTSFFTK